MKRTNYKANSGIIESWKLITVNMLAISDPTPHFLFGNMGSGDALPIPPPCAACRGWESWP